MIPALRARFNREWTPARHEALLEDMAATGATLVTSFLANAEARAAAESLIPARYLGPHQEVRPTCVQVDFGMVREADGRITPRLVELQAFPSLYAFQHTLAMTQREVHALPAEYVAPLGGLDDAAYLALMRDVLVGPHDPAEVVLMEIAPEQQKTRPDFLLTESLWGLSLIHISEPTRPY